VRGEVRNITNFGVFVGLEEGVDGLVHVSDISWTEQIKHPSEKFKKGDVVEAVVLKIDRENEKFSLGIKQLEANPWDDIQKKYPLGSEVSGEITSVTDFGAFVRLEEGIEGLIYSSELASERVEKPSDVVKTGDRVTALVTKVDPVDQKISLSVKALTDREQRDALKRLAAQQAQTQTTTFGDLLKEKLAQMGEE
jgi:small subunit ribosomal protein S1